MFLLEVFLPAGTTSAQRRADIAARLGRALVDGDIAAAETVRSAQDLTDVLVHEVSTWHVGGGPAADGDRSRYLVRASVPGPWRKEMSEHIVTRVTAALASPDDDPDVRIQVVGVPEGGHGLHGRVYGSNDLAELLSEPYRVARRAGTAQPAPEGMYVDPACGAVMPKDTEGIVTAEIDGVTHGFCCSQCRDAYLTELAS